MMNKCTWFYPKQSEIKTKVMPKLKERVPASELRKKHRN